MFDDKFFMASPTFESLFEQRDAPDNQRFQRFFMVVYVMLRAFEKSPLLKQVKITAVATVDYEKIPFSVRVRHHFKCLRIYEGRSVEDKEFLEWMPYEHLGNGVFELSRDSDEVRDFELLLKAPPDTPNLEILYRALVARISYLMDCQFEPCSINHDVGIQVIAP